MENTQNIKDLVQKFYPYAKSELGFEHPVRVIMRKDAENAQNPLGKTAYYDPDQKLIVLYVTDRHPKDILRSFSHELVHHAQNCRGDLDDLTTDGHYAEDGKGREIEEEAYLQGNLNVRDWEDSIKFEGENQMKITKEELKDILSFAIKEIKEASKPDFLDLDKDGDKKEPMKKAAKDKKEKVKEAEEPKYDKSQDKEHDDAKELGSKLTGKLRRDKNKKAAPKTGGPGTSEYGDARMYEQKQVVTETPQQPKESQQNDTDWYNSSLYNKLKSIWTKK